MPSKNFAGIAVEPRIAEVAEAAVVEPVAPVVTVAPKGKRQQARTTAGTFQADDPATPDRNEAFVEG